MMLSKSQVRAILLAAIMVTSMVGLSVSFAGAAAASGDGTIDEVEVSPGEIQSGSNVTVTTKLDDLSHGGVITDGNDYNLTISVPQDVNISHVTNVRTNKDEYNDSVLELEQLDDQQIRIFFDTSPSSGLTSGSTKLDILFDMTLASTDSSDNYSVETILYDEDLYDEDSGEVADKETTSIIVDDDDPEVDVDATGLGEFSEVVTDGDEVAISATVDNLASVETVTADVSAFTATEDDLELDPVGGGKDKYEATFDVNTSASDGDGVHEIDVTATDAAGNDGSGSTDLELTSAELETTGTVDEGTITYTIESTDKLGNITATVETMPLYVELEYPTVEPVEETLTLDDFERVESDEDEGYVYEAAYDTPRDGNYTIEIEQAETETVDGHAVVGELSADSVVDTSPAAVDDAVLGGTDQELYVFFDEPVYAEEIEPADVTVDNATVTGVEAGDTLEGYETDYNEYGDLGGVIVYLEEPLNTDDEPEVEIDGGSFASLAGDDGEGQTSSATIDTHHLLLEEGTNFVSVPAVAGDQDLDDFDTEHVDAIWRHTAGEWERYDPTDDNSDFTTLEGGYGYIVEMDRADVFTPSVHNLPDDTDTVETNNRTLEDGWHLLGHYRAVAQSYDDLGIDDNVDQICTPSPDGECEPIDEDDSDSLFKPGEAYWAYVDGDGDVDYEPQLDDIDDTA